MNVDYVAQPDVQIGRLLMELLGRAPLPSHVVIVSAFANRLTLARFRDSIHTLRQNGAHISIVLGVDLQGTSEEALREVLSWGVDARVIKNRLPGHTFHPKMYLIERPTEADLIIGSTNLTEGGLYKNYEGAVHVHFNLPADHVALTDARSKLKRFLAPTGTTAQALQVALINKLKGQGLVKAEAALRKARRLRAAPRHTVASPFGAESMPEPPALPGNLLEELFREAKLQRQRRRRTAAGRSKKTSKIVVRAPTDLVPTAFYMELPKLQGSNIPGEARIPLAARDVAPDFWGWPGRYRSATPKRGKKKRMYWNWKPTWRVVDSANPTQAVQDTVRMYEYVDSADFRFYSNALVSLGADAGDVVRITRLSDASAEFQCELAKRSSRQFATWKAQCTVRVSGSSRSFGYA